MTGCLHGCPYCYARRIAENPRLYKSFPKGFKPHERFERLSQPGKIKKGAAVFVGSMTDMMGLWWSDEQIQKVINICVENPQHTFLWLTKNPVRYQHFEWPDNCWLGASVETQLEMYRADDLIKAEAWRFLSLEPMLGPINSIPKGIHQIIAGCQTGPKSLPAQPAWFNSIKDQCEESGAHLFIKKVTPKTSLLDGREHKELAWRLNNDTDEGERIK